MKSRSVLLSTVVLALIVGGAIALTWLKKNQKLGEPGIIGTPIPGSIKMKLSLPADVPGFTSKHEAEAKTVVNTLPKDTSFAQRLYTDTNGFWVNANIVLMGMDRTSIHKPQFCLPGQGWQIDHQSTVVIPIGGPHPYLLRVAKWDISKFIKNDKGQKEKVYGFYIFWFVAKNEETDSVRQRIWWLTRDLLTTGVLQRWAYISYFSAGFAPGQADAAFAKIKQLIAASVPEFQLPLKTK